MRDLISVITEILAVIPTPEASLREELRKNQSSALYTPPECMGERWQQVARTLAHFIGSDASTFNEWQRKVRDLYNGPPPVELDTMNFTGDAGGAA